MHTDYESGEGRERFDGDSEKTVRHLLVRTPLLTQLRIAETYYIKAEPQACAGYEDTGPLALHGTKSKELKKQAYHHAHSTGCRL